MDLQLTPLTTSGDVGTITAWEENRLDVFWGSGGQLQHRWYVDDPRTWRPTEVLTTRARLTSPPVACSWGPQRIDLFWRSPVGSLAHKWYDGSWTSTTGAVNEDDLSVDAPLVARPAVCSWGPDRLDVFWRDIQQRLHHRWYDRGWRGQQLVETQVPLVSDPAVAALGVNQIHLFWQRPDGALHHKWQNNGVWEGEESLGGDVSGAPAAVSMIPGVVDVFSSDSDRRLFHRWYDGRWHPWRFVASDQSVGGVCSWAEGRMDLAVLNGSRSLQHSYWTEFPTFTHRQATRTYWQFMAEHAGEDRIRRLESAFASGNLGGGCSGAMISPHLFLAASHCGGPGGVSQVSFYHTDHLGDPEDPANQVASPAYTARVLPWQHSGIQSNNPGERGDTVLLWLNDGADGVPPGIKYGYQQLTREAVQVGEAGYSFYRNPAFRRSDVLLYSEGVASEILNPDINDPDNFQGPSILYDMPAVGGVSGSTNLTGSGANAHRVTGVTQGSGPPRVVPKISEFLRRYDADNNAVPDAVDYDWLITRPILSFRLLQFDDPLPRSEWVAVPDGSAVETNPMGTLRGIPTMAGPGPGLAAAGTDGFWHQTSSFRSGASYRISVVAQGMQPPGVVAESGYLKFHSDTGAPDVIFRFAPQATADRYNGLVTLGNASDYRLIIGTDNNSTLAVESIALSEEGGSIGFGTIDERRSWEYLGDCVPMARGLSSPNGFSGVLAPTNKPWGLRNRQLGLLPDSRYRFEVPVVLRLGSKDGEIMLMDLDGTVLGRQPLSSHVVGGPTPNVFETKTSSRSTTALAFATSGGIYQLGDIAVTSLGPV